MSPELDNNIRALQDAELTLKSLEEVIEGLPFNSDDPQVLRTAILHMEESVDLHMAHFSAYPVVGRMVENFKSRYREVYLERYNTIYTSDREKPHG